MYVPDQQAHDEERACEIAKEGHSPVDKHLTNAQASVKYSKCRKQEASCTQIGSSDDNRDETPGEDDGSYHPYQAWSVFLIPWGGVRRQSCGTSQRK